jgi:hypothetical protein
MGRLAGFRYRAGTLRAALKQAGVEPEVFLQQK